MKKFLFISDMEIGSSTRGAESNDQVIYNELPCEFMTTVDFNMLQPKYERYLISNFSGLSERSKDYLLNKKYSHIAHDFLFCKSRNPGLYLGYEVNDPINVEFLQKAEFIYCQSQLQEKIFNLNQFSNTVNLSGNLWTDDQLDLMVKLGESKKKARAAVIDHPYKGTNESIQLCRNLKIPFDKIGSMDYSSFMKTLAEYSVYVFTPPIIETFCRVLIEAKIMGVVPITTDICGAVHESFYELEGKDLADEMKEKRRKILLTIQESMV